MRFQPLLQLHLIRDPLHAAASARYSYRAVDILARAHEAARLNNTLKCLDFDLGDLQARSLEIAALTLVVMMSSTYSPAPSCVHVDAQPRAVVRAALTDCARNDAWS